MSEIESHPDEPSHRPEEPRAGEAPARAGDGSPSDPGALAEPAHDVLAAEEFAMPAPDPTLHHGPVALPGDPTGIAVAHDVLAAEEFAMPAPEPHVVPGAPMAGSGSRWPIGISAAAAGLLVILARRRLRRR